MMTLQTSNKHKVLALAVVISLHGVAGLGLATMPTLQMEPPKVTPPLEIQMIQLNQEESFEPPEPTPVALPTPTPKSVAAPAPTRTIPPPSLPPKKMDSSKPKQTPKPDPKPTDPIPKKQQPTIDDKLLAQEQAQKNFELQQQKERERLEAQAREQAERAKAEKERSERERAERERAERERSEREQAERARAEKERSERERAERERAERAKIDAENKKRTADGEGKGGDGKDKKTNNKNQGDKDAGNDNNKGGGELKNQNLSISNASWRSKPNYSNLSSETLNGSVGFTARLTIDAKGNITNVSGVSTGDRALDRQISQAIRRAKLHAFKSSSGQPMSGTATYSLTIKLSD